MSHKQTSAGPPPRQRSRRVWWVAGIVIGAMAAVLILTNRAAETTASDPPESATPPGIGSPGGGEEAGSANGPSGGPPRMPGRNGQPTPPSRADDRGLQSPAPGATPPVNPADLPPDHPPVDGPAVTEPKTTLQWFGYSCFYVHSPGGTALVTDPFDPRKGGLPSAETGAHFVTISSEDPLHGFAGVIRAFQGEAVQVLRGEPGSRGDMRLIPIPTTGPAGSANTAYVIEAGPLRIAHLGNLGGPLNPTQLRALGSIDILLIPAGNLGLSPADAVAVTRAINPKVVIPMGYRTPEMSGPAARQADLDAYISASPYAVTRKDQDVMLIGRSELPGATEIFTLRYRH